jgi:hypothetical protein
MPQLVPGPPLPPPGCGTVGSPADLILRRAGQKRRLSVYRAYHRLEEAAPFELVGRYLPDGRGGARSGPGLVVCGRRQFDARRRRRRVRDQPRIHHLPGGLPVGTIKKNSPPDNPINIIRGGGS